MRVLLIDDEPDIRDIVEMMLSELTDWQVLLASSGAEGVATASAQRPDAILLDVMMPGLDGPSTLQQLRLNPATAAIPVLFLTAKAQRSEVERLQSLGAAGVLTKPFDPMRLPDQIRGLLHWG